MATRTYGIGWLAKSVFACMRKRLAGNIGSAYFWRFFVSGVFPVGTAAAPVGVFWSWDFLGSWLHIGSAVTNLCGVEAFAS